MEIKEVCTGLKVIKRDDGHWITFTGNGREASLHVESYLHGGVIQGAVIGWIENQFDEPGPEPEQLSHEEIMTKWWKWINKKREVEWMQVISYSPLSRNGINLYLIDGQWSLKECFKNKEFRDIPPEEEK